MAGTTLRLYPPESDEEGQRAEKADTSLASEQVGRELRTLASALTDAGRALDRIARVHRGGLPGLSGTGPRPRVLVAVGLAISAAFTMGVLVSRTQNPVIAPVPTAPAAAAKVAPASASPVAPGFRIAPAPRIAPALLAPPAAVAAPAQEQHAQRPSVAGPARPQVARRALRSAPVKRVLSDEDGVLEPSFK